MPEGWVSPAFRISLCSAPILNRIKHLALNQGAYQRFSTQLFSSKIPCRWGICLSFSG